MFASWLDKTFLSFDQAILGSIHSVQQSGADWVLGPLARLLAVLGAGGIALVLFGLLLLASPKARRLGAGVLIALALGALVTNVLLKPLVLRPRPYADETRILYRWWLEAGAAVESDASFPSGHTTAMTAAMSVLFLLERRARRWICLFPLVLMPLSRLYLVVHYPTDVLAGLLIGVLAGFAASWTVREAEAKLSDRQDG